MMVLLRALAIASAMLALPAAAGATPLWQPIETLQLVRGVPRADVGINAAGSASVVFSTADSIFDDLSATLAVRPPGGAFTVLDALPGGATDPRIAVAPDGATAIAAVDRDRVVVTLYPSPGPAGAPGKKPSFGTTTSVGVDGLAVDGMQLGIDESGEATVVWVSPRRADFDDPPAQVYVATVRPPGLADKPQPLGSPGRCTPSLDVNLRGDAVVRRSCLGQSADFFYRPAGGTFGAAEAPFDIVGAGGVALDGAGNAHAYETVYKEDPKGSTYEARASYAVRPPGGPFGPAQQLDFVTGGDVLSLEIDAQEDGDVIAAWGSGYAFRPPGGRFGAVRSFGEVGGGSGFDLVTSPHGPALASWRDRAGYGDAAVDQVVAAVIDSDRPASIARLGVRGVFGTDYWRPSSRFAINDAGRAVGVWEQRCSREGAFAVTAVSLDDTSSATPPCQDRRGPKVAVARKRALLGRRQLRVRAICDEDCRLVARVRVLVGGRGKPLATAKTRESLLLADRGRWLKLRLSAAEARRLRRALDAERRLSARLAFSLRDVYGNGVVRRVRVPIRR